MNLLLLCLGSVGAGLVLYSLRQAPDGFQASDGFHLGTSPRKSAPRRRRVALREAANRDSHIVVAQRTAAPEYSEP